MSSISRPFLLTIPLEIRRQVYRQMLYLSLRDHQNLLLVCHQIYEEAKESFFERPLIVQSQEELIQFVQSHTDVFLSQMTNLYLRLQEVNREIMHPYLARAIQGISTPSDEHPYVVETNRILAALFRLPNVCRLRIAGPQDSTMSLPSGLLTTSVLRWAGNHFVKLEQLAIDLRSFQLDSLSGGANLRILEIQGLTESRTTDLLNWCAQLRYLESVTIHGSQQGLHLRPPPGFHNKVKRPASHQALALFPPLKSLSIRECLGPHNLEALLTTKFLKSLHSYLGESLQLLQLSYNHTPPSPILSAMAAFLGSTRNLHTLRLMWPGIQVAFLDCIPYSVTHLELGVTSTDDSLNIVDKLNAMQRSVSHSRQVTLEFIHQRSSVGDAQSEDNDEIEVSKVMVISNRQRLDL
ncbi:hypothetical protein B0A52_07036 [Exophiala mesophila]|uniref:F-box domain-containing protein n=1 Tax=Exophiala mesophila TaxID=212818 RepID=A0A438MZJ1_EXOME|nr:hypothetical protein B0A52_07036 [Exophiala mesophila]